MAIVITSLSEPTPTGIGVYFTADDHWTVWVGADTIVVPDDGGSAWYGGWYPEEPSQYVNQGGLTPDTSYTIQIRRRYGSPGNYTYEYSNVESFTTTVTGAGPTKAKTPTPTNGADDVTLDQATITWEDGGGATSYDVYYGENEAGLMLLSAGQEELSFTIADIYYGSPFDYLTSRTWRIDAISAGGTTTGDVWTFAAIAFYPPLPTGITLDAEGEPTGTPTGESNMITVRKLIAAAENKIWYENI